MKNYFSLICATLLIACNSDNSNIPSQQVIESINLKKGDVIWCGPPMANFGSVHFLVTAKPEIKKEFDQAIAMLHSFEYEEAEKAFGNIIQKDPACAMAYWGVAMSNFHPLWEPPKESELIKGARAIEIARSLKNISPRELEYINAIGRFYDNWKSEDHKSRCLKYEQAMSGLYEKYPTDKEAAIFYALALNTTADPTDKTYTHQKHAGDILNKILNEQPDHPGIIHYIIHTYDNPDLADIALPAARKYASVAPASAHAQHMPSHIFIRLGLWDEAISSNLASVSSAQCYAEKAALAGNFDEELHGLDYLVYSYLQKGDNRHAEEQLNHLKNIKSVSAQNLKVAYAYAAIPARFVIENKNWQDAAGLEPFPATFPWDKFPWQNGITHYARMLGKIHTGDLKGANEELNILKERQQTLITQKDQYKAKQLEVQINTGLAWMELKKGNNQKALELMKKAADMEDGTSKHPVTPGEVVPARELLGDMYMTLNDPVKALEAYEVDLSTHMNRFNGLFSAGLAAQKSGNTEKANMYYSKLAQIAAPTSTRNEMKLIAARW